MFLEIVKCMLKLKQVDFIVVNYINVKFFPSMVIIQNTHTFSKGTMKVQYNHFSCNYSAFVKKEKKKQGTKECSVNIICKYKNFKHIL